MDYIIIFASSKIYFYANFNMCRKLVLIMPVQKSILFKLNEDLFLQLDALCVLYGVKRNTMLNILVSIGVCNLPVINNCFKEFDL